MANNFDRIINDNFDNFEKKQIVAAHRKSGGKIHIEISVDRAFCSVNGETIVNRESYYAMTIKKYNRAMSLISEMFDESN